jgi:hypothetical protein
VTNGLNRQGAKNAKNLGAPPWRLGGFSLVLALAVPGCGEPGAAADEAASACEQGDERQERHGTDCLCCHAEVFTVAGSVEQGARKIESILVRDAAGETLVMTPNAYGNFFLHDAVALPLEAWILAGDGAERRMRGSAPHGSCNRCHREGTAEGVLQIP